MTYKEYIQNIIDTRGQWNISKEEYYELHHIIPKCMGGKGDYKNNSFKKYSTHPNCIYLYPEEHFIAHKLLFLENKNCIELQRAFFIMSNFIKYENMLDEDIYAMCKEYFLQNLKNKESYNKGKIVVSNDIIRKFKFLDNDDVNDFLLNNSDWKLGGLYHTEDEIKKLSEKNKGENNGMFGKKHSEETLKKFKEQRKDIHWYTNGVKNIMCKEENCPEGFYLGRCGDFSKGKKNSMYGKHTANSVKIQCIETGKIYNSIRQATKELKGYIFKNFNKSDILYIKITNSNIIFSFKKQ